MDGGAVGNSDASVFIDSHTAALRPGDDSLIFVRRRDCDGGAVVGDLCAVFSDYRLADCYTVAAGSVDSGYRRAAAYFRGESIICCPCSGIDGVLSSCIKIRKLAAGLPWSLSAQRVLLTVNNRDGDRIRCALCHDGRLCGGFGAIGDFDPHPSRGVLIVVFCSAYIDIRAGGDRQRRRSNGAAVCR